MEFCHVTRQASELNASLVKSKISLRYEMEERLAAEKAAQASQSSVQVVKDQLQNSQDELKSLREKFHRETAKTQRKLNKAEKKAKDEERSRQKYMEGMINLQSKLGHTKSLLETAAIDVADDPSKRGGADRGGEGKHGPYISEDRHADLDEENEGKMDPLVPIT